MELYDSESGEIKMKSAADVYNELIVSINKVYDDVVLGDGFIDKDKHPEEHYLFDNPFRAVDGPCYAFLAHGLGPAVGGQGEKFLMMILSPRAMLSLKVTQSTTSSAGTMRFPPCLECVATMDVLWLILVAPSSRRERRLTAKTHTLQWAQMANTKLMLLLTCK